MFVNKYESCILAAKSQNKNNSSTIVNALKSGKTAYGYLWRYKKDIQESEDTPGSFIMLR